MKKVWIFLLIGVLVLGLTGCKKEDKKVEKKTMYTVNANIEGKGQIAYTEDGGVLSFSDENPITTLKLTIAEDTKLVFDANPDEGYKFVRWTVDGEEYSTELQMNVTIKANTEVVAIFEEE